MDKFSNYMRDSTNEKYKRINKRRNKIDILKDLNLLYTESFNDKNYNICVKLLELEYKLLDTNTDNKHSNTISINKEDFNITLS